MCGIVGYISNDHHESSLADAISAMIHRGPDSQRAKKLELFDKKIGLGHVRLSILDLDPRSDQPFSIDDENYTILFNGEIYNYQSIKDELINRGVQFRTTSDTEVFIQAYKHLGIECVKRFRGIFSAFIVDKIREEAYLVRDHLGVKPLYYFITENGNLFFASELKSLFKFNDVDQIVSPQDICQFLNMGFVMEPSTGFENVKKVLPGAYLKFERNKSLTETLYFQSLFEENSDINQVGGLIKQATKEQALADVPVALLFSGGLDSSILASHLGAETKSLFFDSDRKETKAAGMVDDKFYADKITAELNLDIEHVQPPASEGGDFLKEISHIAAMVEEPISDYTFIASEQLCRKAREHGFKVVISGMGGDEAFGGYPRYILAKNYPFFQAISPLLKLFAPILSRSVFFAKKVQRLLSFLNEKTFALGYIRLIGYLSSKEIKALLKDESQQDKFENTLNMAIEKYKNLTHLKQAMMLDYSGFLSHNLVVADKSSMQASVEMRVPLLSPDVYQSGLQQKCSELISGSKQKFILQKLLKKQLPSNLVSRPKTGFNPPSIIKLTS